VRFKPVVRVGTVVGLLIAAGVGIAAWQLLRAGDAGGDTALERWIGGQLKRVANGHLNPTLDFDELDYQCPKTVVVTGVRLIADDARGPDGRSAILSAKRLELTLDCIPKEGEPIVIRDVIAQRPTVRLIAAGPGAGLVGFSDLVKQTGTDASPGGDAPPLSQVFRMHRVVVRDAAVEYDARGEGDAPPLRLDQINTQLVFEPDASGWYGLDLSTTREPILDLAVKGRLNLDTMTAEFAQTTLAIDLAAEQHPLLPAPVQQLLANYDARGVLEIDASGTVSLNAPQQARIDATLEMRDAHFAAGDYRVPVSSLDAVVRVVDGVVTLEGAEARTMGGRVEAHGIADLTPDLPSDVRVQLIDLHLEKLVRGGEAQIQAGQVSGLVNGQAHFTTPLAHATTRAAGNGQVDITEGRLAKLPVVGTIAGALASAAKAKEADQKHTGRDTASVTFELAGDHANLTRVTLSTPLIAAEGTGKVGFDESLYLDLRAGPLKKLTNRMGVLGKALDQVTDGLTRYRVTGTLGEPKVDVLVLAAPDEKPTTDTPREEAASEIFDDLDNNDRRDRDEDKEDDQWEERRERNRDLLGL